MWDVPAGSRFLAIVGSAGRICPLPVQVSQNVRFADIFSLLAIMSRWAYEESCNIRPSGAGLELCFLLSCFVADSSVAAVWGQVMKTAFL